MRPPTLWERRTPLGKSLLPDLAMEEISPHMEACDDPRTWPRRETSIEWFERRDWYITMVEGISTCSSVLVSKYQNAPLTTAPADNLPLILHVLHILRPLHPRCPLRCLWPLIGLVLLLIRLQIIQLAINAYKYRLYMTPV
jgi:hypothetical protein